MDVDSDDGFDTGSMLAPEPGATQLRFAELEDSYSAATNYCWLCEFAFRKSAGGSGPDSSPLMNIFFNTYMANREHMNLRQLSMLLETNYLEEVHKPLYESGKHDVYLLTRDEIEIHLRSHTIDMVQTVINATHDLVIEIEMLKDQVYTKLGNKIILDLDKSKHLIKLREANLKYQTFLAAQRRT